MTVSAVTPYINYTLTGISTYPFTFGVFSDSEIVVTHTDMDDNVAVLTLNVDYTVTLNPDRTGDVVISDLTLLGTLSITRNLAITQEVDWVNNDPLDMVVQENSFDKLTMILQDMNTQSVVFPSGFPDSVAFPLPEAESIIGWDATGTTLVNYAGYGDLANAIALVEAALVAAETAEANALAWAQEAANCYAAVSEIYTPIMPAADLTGSGQTSLRTVDVNATGISAALFVASDGNLEEADATDDTAMPCSALALEAGTGSVEILRQGYMRNDSWSWTPGGMLYVSTTAGALTQTPPNGSGEMVQIVGVAESATVIFFNPEYTMIEVA